MAADPRAQAVFLLKNLIGYDHRPEFVNEHNASYRSDVLNVAQVFDAMQRAAEAPFATPRESVSAWSAQDARDDGYEAGRKAAFGLMRDWAVAVLNKPKPRAFEPHNDGYRAAALAVRKMASLAREVPDDK